MCLPMLKRTSGGSSDSELNELTVMPSLRPSTAHVTTQTPVGNCPSACRKAIVSQFASDFTAISHAPRILQPDKMPA